jgi:hypothetical protein
MLQNGEMLATGIVVYRDVFKKDLNLIPRLEKCLDVDQRKKYTWNQATTGYSHTDLKYRDCFDFKIRVNEDDSITTNSEHCPTGMFSQEEIDLAGIWKDAHSVQVDPVLDYRIMFNLAELKYWESFNFVKYGKDQHFQVHSDHGYSYSCVLSSVGYLNDDYEGGELFFDKLNLKIKPRAGDLYLFPSAYVYSHAAMPVLSGTKYSIVTMLDYMQTTHTPDFFKLEEKYNQGLL